MDGKMEPVEADPVVEALEHATPIGLVRRSRVYTFLDC
jgi:hypothetical protein